MFRENIAAKTNDGIDIIAKCVKDHEQEHVNVSPLEEPNCKLGEVKPLYFKKGTTMQQYIQDEIARNKTELGCLKKVELPPQTNPDTVIDVEDRKSEVEGIIRGLEAQLR